MIKWLKCLFVRGHHWIFDSNVYGDQIMTIGGDRSIWKCSKCGAYQHRRDLHYEEAKGMKE